MNNGKIPIIQCSLFLILVIIFMFRFQSIGGLDFQAKYSSTDPQLENFAENFVPIREYLTDLASKIMPEPQAGLLSGIVLGAKGSIDSDLKKQLVKTSTIHIAVASGQNLTLVAGFLMGLAPVMGRKKSLIIVLVAVLGYSLLTGFAVPVIRALIMFFFGVLAQLGGREGESLFVTILTALLMLIYHPEWVYSVSFQLSFLATLGVVVVAPILQFYLDNLGFIGQDLAVTIAVFALTLPVISSNFHQLSLIGILVNSLILWIVPLVMVFGVSALLAGLIFLPLAQILVLIPKVLLDYFLIIIQFFSGLSWGVVYVGKIGPLVWMGYYMLVYAILWSLQKKINKKIQETSNI